MAERIIGERQGGAGDEPYLGRRDAAKYLTERGLPTSARTLEKKATSGGGPAYRIFNGRAIYRPGDLVDWAESCCSPPHRHTSETVAMSRQGPHPAPTSGAGGHAESVTTSSSRHPTRGTNP